VSQSNASKTLAYFSEKYSLNGFQLVKDLHKGKEIGRIKVMDAEKRLGDL